MAYPGIPAALFSPESGVSPEKGKRMIRLEDLEIRLPGFSINKINLFIDEGEFFTLLGPTGAGKTLVLEAISGLFPVNGGRIFIGEMDVTTTPIENRGIGIMYQDYALFPHLSVMQNISYGLRYRKRDAGDSGKDLGRLIDLLELGRLMGRSIENLSGGEKQRVSLARALAVDPRVLLLDEPLSALDPNFREEIWKMLKRIHRETGITILMVTHDFAEALYLGQRAAIINKGSIMQEGTVRDLFRFPSSCFVARFVGMKNIFPADLTGNRAKIDSGVSLELGREYNNGEKTIAFRPEDVVLSREDRSSRGYSSMKGKILAISENGSGFNVLAVAGETEFHAHVVRRDFLEMDLADMEDVYINLSPSVIHAF
ncbi:MAG: ABC transporter ATP-binding protein [Deltaproteobacteria bacterium]|nr:ABC transporter ATP-binding protein [Deltaproteobacteria bacterium]